MTTKEPHVTKGIFTGLCALILVCFSLLIMRLYYLQVSHADAFREQAYRRIHALVPESPCRGMVIDSRGRILAASKKVYHVFVEPRTLLSDPEQTKLVSAALQDILHVPGHEICQQIYDSKNPGYVRIAEDITSDQRDELRGARLGGVGIETAWQREYPMDDLTSHVVGFVGWEQNGLGGVELGYDSKLRGEGGQDIYLVDVGRKPIAIDLAASRPAQQGQGVVLTIDSTIQHIVKTALARQVQAYEAESGIAIVIHPETGEILAMVSLPDYNPAEYSKEVQRPDEPMKNRALCDPYEPGSIFKPIVTAIALDAGAIGYEDIIDCEDGYFQQYRISEFAGHRYGKLSVRDIIAESSNIGMAKIGLKLGRQRLYEGVRLFGFGAETRIDLPGEDLGILAPPDKWSDWSVTRIPFGHEIAVTSVQVARAFCTLANEGIPVTPHIVKAIVDENGNMKEITYPPNAIGRVVRPEVARWIVQDAMVEVVNEGTGTSAQLPDLQTFGKTGTANIARSKEDGGGYDEQNYIASFAGGVPAEDPKLIVLVSIRRPNRSLGMGYSGGRVAAPVFHEIVDRTLNYLDPARPARLAQQDEGI